MVRHIERSIPNNGTKEFGGSTVAFVRVCKPLFTVMTQTSYRSQFCYFN